LGALRELLRQMAVELDGEIGPAFGLGTPAGIDELGWRELRRRVSQHGAAIPGPKNNVAGH
jgi:hypothetical protein